MHFNLRGIIRHDSVAIGIDIKEITDWHFAQTVDMKRRRLPVAARGNEAVAVPNTSVAGRAVDVEAVAAASQILGGYRERHIVAIIVTDSSVVQVMVFIQMAACC